MLLNNKIFQYVFISSIITIIVLCISNVLFNSINIFIKDGVNRDVELCITYLLLFIVNIMFFENMIKRFFYIINNNELERFSKIVFSFNKIHRIIVIILSLLILSLEIIYRINLLEIEIKLLYNILISGIITEVLILIIYTIILKEIYIISQNIVKE